VVLIFQTANADIVISWRLVDGKLACVDEAVLAGLEPGSIFAEFFPRQTRASDNHNTPVVAVLTRKRRGWSVELDLSNFALPDVKTSSTGESKVAKELVFEGDVEEVTFSVAGLSLM
jgi:hypothetical protein